MLAAFEDVCFSFPSREVLRGVTLQVRPGRVTALLGPNGAGKTTLLRLLLGTLQPSSGRVSIEGRSPGEYGANQMARRIAYVPQQTPMGFAFRVEQIVLMGRSPHTSAMGFERPHDREAVEKAMALTEVTAFADRTLSELSGGECQRVILARALAQEPQLILLDEPTSFLDLKHQLALYSLLVELAHERGLGILCISHDVNLSAQFADEVAMLHEGRILASGPPGEVITRSRIETVYDVPVRVEAGPDGRPFIRLSAPWGSRSG